MTATGLHLVHESGDRAAALDSFLDAAGWQRADRWLLTADASFRHYDRLRMEGQGGAVLMNAPPDKEPVWPFLKIARIFHRIGLSAPRILAEDPERGFLLLEDLGDDTFTRALARGVGERPLYELAIDTLACLHERWTSDMGENIPPYDERVLLQEASLLVDWFLPAVTGTPTSGAAKEAYRSAWRQAFAETAQRRETLVHRDYHVDNLMLLNGRDGIASCGLLDFQDALIGSRAYDLVSLLEDARRDVTPALAADMLARYLARRPQAEHADLLHDYAVLGLQRNLKIVGIFTRLDRRDGKPRYLAHIPRLWRLVAADLERPAVAPLAAWFDEHLPPALRIRPESRPGEGVAT